MFKITRGSGFQMTFGNGWTVSVQWGACTYSSNYGQLIGTKCEKANSAEIAAWDAARNWYKFEDGDTVKGYCTTGDVAAFITLISNMEP
jgi:hypothetical protein